MKGENILLARTPHLRLRSDVDVELTGTADALQAWQFKVEAVPKMGQGPRDVVQRIEAGEVDLVINTVGSDPLSVRDSAALRRAALLRAVPYFTTVAAARAGSGAIRALQLESIGVRTLQEIHA